MVLRIFKMIATSGFLTALECTKFVFGRVPVLDPTGEAYSAPADLLANLRGPISKRRERRERVEKKSWLVNSTMKGLSGHKCSIDSVHLSA